MAYYQWGPYVPVAERQRKAKKKMEQLRKKGHPVSPVEIAGRKIAKTFWGEAWCTHLEGHSDFANRLPRGKRYARNGSVVDLQIKPGVIESYVSGSSLYRVRVEISSLSEARWRKIIETCAGQIRSLLELLQGKLSNEVMAVLCDRRHGLLPHARDISMSCSCPDWATMCKHVAATLYGVGARLDTNPELLFTLCQVDSAALLKIDDGALDLGGADDAFGGDDLGALFGIDLATDVDADAPIEATPTTAAAAGERVRSRDLTARGVPHSQIQYWRRSGVLESSGERGVYLTTAQTAEAIDAYLARRGIVSAPATGDLDAATQAVERLDLLARFEQALPRARGRAARSSHVVLAMLFSLLKGGRDAPALTADALRAVAGEVRAPQLDLDRLTPKAIERALTALAKADLLVALGLDASEALGGLPESLHLDRVSLMRGGERSETRLRADATEEAPEGIAAFYMARSDRGTLPISVREDDDASGPVGAILDVAAAFEEGGIPFFVLDSRWFADADSDLLRDVSWVMRVPEQLEAARALLEDPETFTELEPIEGRAELRGAEWIHGEGPRQQRWLVVQDDSRRAREVAALSRKAAAQQAQASRALSNLTRRRFTDADEALAEVQRAFEAWPLCYAEFDVFEHRSGSFQLRDANAIEDREAIEVAASRAGAYILATNVMDEAALPVETQVALYERLPAPEAARGLTFLRAGELSAPETLTEVDGLREGLCALLALAELVHVFGRAERA